MVLKKFKKNKDAEDIKESIEEEQLVENEPDEKLEHIKSVVRGFVLTYKYAFVGFGAMLILLLVSSFISGDRRSVISDLNDEISNYNNNIQLSGQREKVTVLAAKPASLSSARWANDDTFVLSYLTNAFQHANIAEYNAHVEEYADLDTNIALIQYDYFNVSGPVFHKSEYIGDISDLLSSRITEFESIVVAVNNDAYTYLTKMSVKQDVYDEEGDDIETTTLDFLLEYTCAGPIGSGTNYSVSINDLEIIWLD